MEAICKNCKHFRLHYIKSGRSYRALSQGHCVYPRRKPRPTEQAACEHFRGRSAAGGA